MFCPSSYNLQNEKGSLLILIPSAFGVILQIWKVQKMLCSKSLTENTLEAQIKADDDFSYFQFLILDLFIYVWDNCDRPMAESQDRTLNIMMYDLDEEATKILFDFGSGLMKSCGNGVCFAPTILRPLCS